MADDFIENLTSLTNNLEDIAFTRYVTITNINADGTIDCREENGTTHKNIKTNNFMNFNVDDTVILGFVDNNIYEPFVLSANDIDLDMSYSELLTIIENYEQLSNKEYTLFRGDCWTINNNFESSASITSVTDTDLTITGTFRTKQDLLGLYWNSDDPIQHPYISYGSRYDYSNVILEFDYNMSGCRDFSHEDSTITINTNAGEIFYVKLADFIEDNHVTIPFNNLKVLAGHRYFNNKGEWVTVTEDTPIDVVNVKNIMFVLIPVAYDDSSQYEIMSNVDFTCEISNISVVNNFISHEHNPLSPHKYRLCEDYDDIYNINPRRLVKEMFKLGYHEWVDLYIGASHYYEKNGTVGDHITDLGFNHNRTEKMKVKTDTPLTPAFSTWLDCYARELKANNVNNLIISVSMENLQCDTSWRQKDCNGNYAVTGWIPSTFFYSPCNSDVIEYMQSVSKACLDILVDNELPPILQLGEAWWWWNVNDTPGQPPCFYDASTKNAYHTQFGENMPEYDSSWETDYDKELMDWLNQQLVAYSDELRSIVKNPDDYTEGQYMALFFPPSVTDVDRVPSMMREVNYIRDAYTPLKLDVFELEDYDWVTGESIHHEEVYSIGSELGFNAQQLHYYGGFVLEAKNAHTQWPLIKTAMDTAFDKKFGEVFVWAGTQVRRDNKYIGYDGYEAVSLLLNQQDILNRIYEYLTKIVVAGGYDDSEIRELLDTKEDLDNKTSSWHNPTNNIRYPSEKLVKDSLDLKANINDLATVATSGSYLDLSDTPDTLNPTANKIPDNTIVKYLNDYVTAGFYYCSYNDYAKYINNCPLTGNDNKAFYLIVEQFEDNNSYAKQTLMYHDDNTIYTRLLVNGSWTSWEKYSKVGHTHDDRYYTESEVDSIISSVVEELLNRISLSADKTVIQTDMISDIVAFAVKDGVPFIGQDVYFYKVV